MVGLLDGLEMTGWLGVKGEMNACGTDDVIADLSCTDK